MTVMRRFDGIRSFHQGCHDYIVHNTNALRTLTEFAVNMQVRFCSAKQH